MTLNTLSSLFRRSISLFIDRIVGDLDRKLLRFALCF